MACMVRRGSVRDGAVVSHSRFGAVMPAITMRLRAILWPVHRWIGIGFCLLLVPIAVSGALLVYKNNLDALLHPSRYAVTGAEMSQPLATYLANAGKAAGAKAEPIALRFPAGAGWP